MCLSNADCRGKGGRCRWCHWRHCSCSRQGHLPNNVSICRSCRIGLPCGGIKLPIPSRRPAVHSIYSETQHLLQPTSTSNFAMVLRLDACPEREFVTFHLSDTMHSRLPWCTDSASPVRLQLAWNCMKFCKIMCFLAHVTICT